MGSDRIIRLAILTSSRADFGIYLPLLNNLRNDSEFSFDLIAFGTHLSPQHGYTISEIEESGFEVKYKIVSHATDDTPGAIANSFSITCLKFSAFWETNSTNYDYVFCLGDRFEMAGAVLSGIPFGIKFLHLHGGETTLGAIDNVYRHSITLASYIHFVSTENFKRRVKELTGEDKNCFVVGALSLDALTPMTYLSLDEFQVKWGIDLRIPTILVTVHPETIAFQKNQYFADQITQALKSLSGSHQIVITMPNADTGSMMFRKKFEELNQNFPTKIFAIENLGKQSYFTCMKYVDHLIGNTSSGIIEAASFKKFVINLGDRQKGRLSGENVIHVPFIAEEIIKASHLVNGKNYNEQNIYYQSNSSQLIIKVLKETNGKF
jgi:GDP/UDP-N,N'-diacetylbacillosamine 2-epimerase (hydrolysing)